MPTPSLNYETLIADLKQTAHKFIGVNHFKVRGADVILQISDSAEVNARAYPSANDQYIVRIYRGILEACLDFVNTKVSEYYSTIEKQTDFNEYVFLRAVCSCATEYIFLHEYSHIIRGHTKYQDERSLSWEEDPKLKIADKRFLELDADIYAANILLAHTYAVFTDSRNSHRLEDLMKAYVIGIRSMFETLYNISEIEDLIHEESDHPHSQIRAYVALSMGVSGAISEKLGKDKEKCRALAMREFSRYEAFLYKGRTFNPIFLQSNLKRELNIWTDRTQSLVPYYLLEVHTVSFSTKAREWLQR